MAKKSLYTAENLKEWKEKYFSVFEVKVGDKVAIMRYPDFLTYQQAIQGLKKNTQAFVMAFVNNCIIAGDENIATSDEDYFNLKEQIDEALEMAEVTTTKHDNHFVIIVDGNKEFKCKPLTREVLNLAERHDQGGKPFVRNKFILDKVLIDGDQEVLKEKNPYYYIPLLSQMEQLYEKKVVTIKKLF